MDDNFASIVKAVMWGRSVFDNIRKFLQFQLTVNIVALTLTFLSALTGHEPPLNAVMMLWVNLIMDTMGALALGTEPPSPLLLYRRPYKRNASLINNKMMRNIAVQFLFQMTMLGYLLFEGANDFETVEGSRQHFTIIFNAFVFCQVFNELNARSIGDDIDVFHGLSKNLLFIQILAFTVVAQFVLVQFGGDFVRTAPLTQNQWVKCFVLGSLSLPLGGFMRLIPIFESERDFAEVSPLIKQAQGKVNIAAPRTSPFQLSFLLWLAVVGLAISASYYEFADKWSVHAKKGCAYPQAHSLISKYFPDFCASSHH